MVRRPPGFAERRDPVVAHDQVDQALLLPSPPSREKPVSRPPGGAIRTEAKIIRGRRTSPAKRKLPSDLAGRSSRGSGSPDELAGAG